MKKQALTGLGVAALVTSGLVLTGNAYADDGCSPIEATPASFSAWVVSGQTEWIHDDVVPADPDGHSGAEDPANLAMIGGEPTTRTHVTQKATADTTVFDHWQRYSLKGAFHDDFDQSTQPPSPSERPEMWQANVQGDPHGHGSEGAYYRSNENSGNGDWFYLQAVTVTVPGHAEVSHVDYQYDVLERTYTPAVAGATCPATVPTTPSDDAGQPPVAADGSATDPAQAPAPVQLGDEDRQVPTPQPAASPAAPTTAVRPRVSHDSRTPNAAVPTVIDAGR